MTWIYHKPGGTRVEAVSARADREMRAWPQVETVGSSQLELLLRARRSPSHGFVLQHDRASDAQRSTADRLQARGLLQGLRFGNAAIGITFAYTLTERGQNAWLRCWEVK